MEIKIFVFLFFIYFTFASTNEWKKTNDIEFPFWDESLPLGQRLDDLMKRLTVDEMVEQMMNGGGYPPVPTPAIERLGIPAYNFDSECLRGIPSLNSTAFPMPLNMAATFSADLAYQVASAVSIEARGFFNEAFKRKDYGDMKGLNCFAPFVNMARHPLWGRNQENFGEDPYLIGIMGESYIKGLQGEFSEIFKDAKTLDVQSIKGRYLRMIGGCKHFVAHSGPDNIPSSRFSFNAKVLLRDFLLSYLPAFERCIDAGAQNIMCSYNSLNGVPTCGSRLLLQDLLRDHMAFGGFVVSDMGAIENIYTGHNYTKSLKEAGAKAAYAGVDLNLHGSGPNAFSLLKEAVKEDLLPLSALVNSTRRLFRARFLLGLFDPADLNPYRDISTEDVVQSESHRRLALEVAERSVVLLKNQPPIMPIKSFGRLSMIGPACDDLVTQFGGYTPVINPLFSSTPYQALKKHATKASLTMGCKDIKCEEYNSTEVVRATKNTDFIVVCLGTGVTVEEEGSDRASLKLPGHQERLLSEVISHASAPIVLLTFSGCPVDIERAKSSSKVAAILHAFYPGQATGEALENLMLLKNSQVTSIVTSPSGRLPLTWPASMQQIPPMEDYSMKGRTYRYSSSTPLYPFGYGLSYSSFSYSNLTISPNILNCKQNGGCILDGDQIIHVRTRVANTGAYDAEEVIQVYISWKSLPASIEMPKLQLVAFKRIMSFSGSELDVELPVKVAQLRVLDEENHFIYFPGVIDVFVGGQQPFTSTTASSNVLHSSLLIVI